MADTIKLKIGLDGVPQVQAGLRGTASAADKLADSFSGVSSAAQGLKTIAGTVAGAVSVREFLQAADAVAVLRNQLALASGSAQAASTAYGALYQIAQRSRVSFTDLGGTFASISRAVDGLGVSQQRLLTVTEAIANAMAISGGNAAGMQAALTQLGQGLASGTLRGDELNSVLEQTPRLARAIADGMGVTVGKLRELGKEGEITGTAVLNALESQAATLAKEVQGATVTVGQALTQMSNAATNAAGEFDRVTGSSRLMVSTLQAASTSLDDIAGAYRDVGTAGEPARAIADAVAIGFETIAVLGANVAYVLKGVGNELGGLAAQAVAVARGEFSVAAEIGRQMKADAEAARAEVDRLSGAILNARRLRDQTAQLKTPAETFRTGELEAAKYVAASGRMTMAAKANKDALRELQREQEKQRSILNAVAGVTDDYVETLGRLQAMRKTGALAEADYVKQIEGLIARQPSAIQQAKERAEAERELANALAGTARLSGQLAQAELQQIEALERQAATLYDQINALDMSEEALTAQAVATMRANAADLQWQADTEGGNALLSERARLLLVVADRTEQLAGGQAKARERDAAQQSAKETADAYQREFERVSEAFTSNLMQGGKSAMDYLEDYVRTLVLRPILQPVGNIIASLVSGASGSSAAAGGGAGAAVSLAGSFASLANAYKFYTGSGPGTLSGNYQQLYGQFATSAVGQYLGLSTPAVVGNNVSAYVAPQVTAAGSTVGQIIPYIGWAIAAYQGASSAYKQGFSAQSLDNKGLQSHPGILTQGVLEWMGLNDKYSNILSGASVVSKLWGHAAPRIEAQGVTGSITGGDFSGQAFADILRKGGIFRSDDRSTEYGALTDEVGRFLDDAAAEVLAQAKKYSEALGLPTQALASVSEDIRIVMTDDIEANKAEIVKALSGYGDALVAGFADELEPLTIYGETVAQTIERVGGALASVNDTLAQLGLDQLTGSVAGGGAAVQLAGSFGDANGFSAAASSYYQAFYSEQERAASLVAKLGDTFADLGLQMIDLSAGGDAARSAFRQLVDDAASGGKLLTESGRNTFAALLQLSGVVDAVAASADKAAQDAARVDDQRTQLRIQLERALGNEAAATALQRERELAALQATSPALVQLQKDLYAAIDAAAAAARLRGVQSGADANVADFLSGNDLQQYRAQRILDILGEGGITGDISGVLGSTKDVVLDLWNAVGVEGKEAILNALPLWRQLMEQVNAIQTYREGTLGSAIETARLATMKPQERIASLRAKETRLTGLIATADDPVAVAQQLQDVVMQRIEEEAALREQIDRSARQSLEDQLDAALRLKDTAADLRQFTGSLGSNSRYSPYNAATQVSSAKALFERTVAGARAGDMTALRNLQGNAQNYLDAAQRAYASGPAYGGVFEQVNSVLDLFASQIEANDEASQIQQQIDRLTSLDDTAAKQLAALLSIDAALQGRLTNDSAVTSAGSSRWLGGTAGTEGDGATRIADISPLYAQPIEPFESTGARIAYQREQIAEDNRTELRLIGQQLARVSDKLDQLQLVVAVDREHARLTSEGNEVLRDVHDVLDRVRHALEHRPPADLFR